MSAPQSSSGEQALVDEIEEVDAPAEDSDSAPRSRSPRKPSKARLELLEQEGEIAADYLEGLLDIADLDGDIDMDVEGDRAAVSIVGADLKQLVGRGGNVLDAVQELTRLAVLRATGERSRLILDIGGFRAARRAELTELGRKSAEEARTTNKPVKLSPMTPFERKVVHDAVAAAGLRSESEGEEPNRRVVVHPS
jgi:spoIIIJ-associated protein